MTASRPFRFGVALPAAASAADLREKARMAEDLGYSLLLCSDHLHQRLAPIPAVVAAAEATTSLWVGTYVLDHDLHHPVVLARELATIDELSGGRLQIGMGAGWLISDYTTAGIPFDRGRVRAERFMEAFTIVKTMLAGEPCSFQGTYFTVEAEPVANDRRRPPLMIGAGQRRLLEFAAREADIVSFTPRSTVLGSIDEDDVNPERYDEKVQWVRDAAGAAFEALELNQVTWECWVTPRPDALLQALSQAMGREVDEIMQLPSMLVGSPEQVADTLLERRARWGTSLVTVPDTALRHMAPVIERLASA